MIFESETGSNLLEINMNEYQWGGGYDIYCADKLLPEIVYGGLCSNKSLSTEYKLCNISIF